MKIIFKIAKTELRKLFYSPVAWIILVIFTFQVTLYFAPNFGSFIHGIALGYKQADLTHRIYSGLTGTFYFFASYLYFYIPLLTMGIVSRELNSGSIKLFYSSPVTNLQIILGKYVALMIFGLVLLGILLVLGIFGGLTIVHADIPQMICGFLGVYLLICAYAAIGLFVSTLTQYQVVAAIVTLAIFGMLAYVKGIGQDVEIVRDVTYWLAISGRVETFIQGMITTEDVLYFLIVSILFIALTIIRLQAHRYKVNVMVTAGRYAVALLAAMALGYFSAMPKLKKYADLDYTKRNTLSRASQEVMKRLPDNVVITTYTNMLGGWQTAFTTPVAYKSDVSNFEQYLRFNPTIRMKYVYFYHKTDNPFLDERYPMLNDAGRLDTLKKLSEWNFTINPYTSIASKVNLESEDFRTTRVIEIPAGSKTFLRFFDDPGYQPSEAEISAAFKRLIMELPTVGFVTGQGERSVDDQSERGYNMFTNNQTFRYALLNQGFNFETVSLDKPVPARIKIMVIAEMKRLLNSLERQHLDDYIASGGNIIIQGEPGRQEIMNTITDTLGVHFLPGTLAHDPGKYMATSVQVIPTDTARKQFWFLENIVKYKTLLILPTVSALSAENNKGFKVLPWFRTMPDSCWSELHTTNFVDDTAHFNPEGGEEKSAFITMLGLERKVGTKMQKILISGDADWLSSGEFMLQRKQFTANGSVMYGVFSWLSDGEVPIDTRGIDPIDNDLRIGRESYRFIEPLIKWVFPAVLAVAGILIWVRRKGR